MIPPSSLALLTEQLLAGHPDAAEALYSRLAQRLHALARLELDRRVAARVDPQDVVQSVFRSFFGRAQAGQFTFADPEKLWSLLVVMTLRKCCRQARQHLAQRRDARREAPTGDEIAVAEERILDREPTSEEAAILAETIEQLARQLGSPLKQRVFELSLQGCSVAEIAGELNYYERGVKRVRAEIREILTRLNAE